MRMFQSYRRKAAPSTTRSPYCTVRALSSSSSSSAYGKQQPFSHYNHNHNNNNMKKNPKNDNHHDDHHDHEDRLANYEASLTELESTELHGTSPTLKSIEILANWVNKGKLKLNPKYQRTYVWKEDRASRLVVTVLCNRLVPGIVLHEREKGQYEVVDGKQRLTTLISFYLNGEQPKTAATTTTTTTTTHYGNAAAAAAYVNSFTRLSKLDENYNALNGLAFADLSKERQQVFEDYQIACSIIPHKAKKEDVFSCYEDINSGGEDLSAQQLRRAVYYGPYIELLDQLALYNVDFHWIRKPDDCRRGSYKPCDKESDRELILRAFSWAHNYDKFKNPIKNFLNTELDHYERLGDKSPHLVQEELHQKEEEFKFIMKIWRNVFSEEDGAFRAWEPKASSKNTTTTNNNNGETTTSWSWSAGIKGQLWDVLYVVSKELRLKYPTEPVYTRNKQQLKHVMKQLFELGQLDLTGPTSTAKFLHRRDTLVPALTNVLREDVGAGGEGTGVGGGATTATTTTRIHPVAYGQQRRSFSNALALKVDLYEEQKGLCTLCQQSIDRNRLDDGSYVHLDHVIPYSKGGWSGEDNASLTHAACNLSKGARGAGGGRSATTTTWEQYPSHNNNKPTT
ncbi:hypothetical protein ACA910_005670 [Epithemia clementina (nom. ined.)]